MCLIQIVLLEHSLFSPVKNPLGERGASWVGFHTGRERCGSPGDTITSPAGTSQSPDCFVLLKQSKWHNPITVIIMTDVSLSNSIYYQVRPLHGKLL